MDNIIERCRKYFSDIIGVKVSISEFKELNGFGFPYVIIDNYFLYNLKLFDHHYVLLNPKKDNDITPASYYKQLQIVKNCLDKDVVLLKSVIDSFNRKRLIGYKIPFIVPGTQMYLPGLMIDLREHFAKVRFSKESFSPATQSIF